MKLENTQDKFVAIVDEWGGENKERLENQLRSLLHRCQMDVRNEFSRLMSSFEIETKNLPNNPED